MPSRPALVSVTIALVLSTFTTTTWAQDPADIQCYEGTAVGQSLGGVTAFTWPVLLRREVDPLTSQITERILQLSYELEDSQIVLAVDAASSTFTLAESTFPNLASVEGTLQGEPWRWNNWSSQSVIAGAFPIHVQSVDNRTESTVSAEKTVTDPAGNTILTISEALIAFPCLEFDQRIEALSAQAAARE